jgi:long-chain fatty acid transport protein
VGRYHAIKSDLRTVNLNPSLAVKLDHGWSIGAGVSALYTDVELTRSIDVCAGRPLALGGPNPGGCDARTKVSGDDWSFGYNLGVLFELDERTRIGAAYRKWMKPHVEGDGKFNFSAATPAAMLPALTAPRPPGLGLVDGTDASAKVALPDSVSVSAFHALTPEWAVMADVSWTHWSVVDTIRIDFDSGAESTLALDYKDSWRYSVGVAYTPGGGPLTWRLGFAYDEEPVRNAETRTPRLPGNDRRWLAIGVGYRLNEAVSFDVGYAHLFVSDTEIRNRESSGALTHSLTGDYKLAVDIVGAQVNWRFQ